MGGGGGGGGGPLVGACWNMFNFFPNLIFVWFNFSELWNFLWLNFINQKAYVSLIKIMKLTQFHINVLKVIKSKFYQSKHMSN